MKTYMANAESIERRWYILDASGKSLGRLATEAATLLRGKHKPVFTPNADLGDHVIIVNASKVRLTGRKASQKHLRWYTGYPGGLKSIDYATLMATNPQRAVYHAVKGMVPHNRLGRKVMKRLRIYPGPDHPHAAQQPSAWERNKLGKGEG